MSETILIPLLSPNCWRYDRDVLKKLLTTETPYIGILGPKKRFDKMLRDYSDENLQLSERDWDRIHAPIGIDIGAETPDEIAISIIAEVMGKFTYRDAGYLKFRNSPIHRRDTESDQVFKETIF
jgi:xanthine dehydrogenase accessory factor